MKSSRWSVVVGVMLLAVGTASCGKDPNVIKQRYLASGNQAFQQKRYADAIIEYRNALQQDPRFPEAQYKLAQAYDQLGDGINAAPAYVRAADLLPGDADAQVRAGIFLLASGSIEDAKARAMKALQVNPRHVEAQILLAQATAGLKDLNGAIDQIEQAIRMDPTEPLMLTELGGLRLAQGDGKSAEGAFKRAVSLDSKSLPANLALGRFYLSTGRTTDAEDWLKKAVAIAPSDPVATRALAALYIGTNRLADAEAPLKASAQASSSPAAKLVLADYYFAVQRNNDARTILVSVINEPTVFSEARLRLSVLEWREKHRSEADKWVDQIIAKSAKDSQANLLKGRYLLSDGQFARARDLLKISVEANPRVPAAHYWLGTAYRALGDADAARGEFVEALRIAPREAGSKLQLAQLELQAGRPDSAESLASEVVRNDPRSGEARLIVVDALIAQGKLPAALKEADFLSTNLPKKPEPQLQVGRIYLKQGNYPAAQRAFRRAIDLSDGGAPAVGGLVDTLIAEGKLSEARAVAEAPLAKAPANAAFLLVAARIYKAAGDSAKAEATLKSVVRADPANLNAYVELSRIYVREKRLDEARAQFEAIVANQPKAVWARTMIAMIFHVEDRKADARQQYERILAIDPRAAIAANNLAMLLLQDGQSMDRALELAQTAKQQLPDSPEVNDTLGSVYVQKGLGGLAVPPLEISVHKDPSNPVFQYHLGQAYAQIGRRVDARAALERALALGGGFDGAADARRLLAQNR